MTTNTQNTNIQLQAAKSIPFIKELPLIGSQFAFNKDRLRLFLRIIAECGDVGGFHFGPYPMFLFNAPAYVQSILVEHAYDFDKGALLHNVFRPIVGNGLFISEGDFHRQQRKLIAPTFHPRHLSVHADTIVLYGQRIQQQWQDGSIIDINRQMTSLTMSISGKALFDADVFDETDELGRALTITFAYLAHQLSALFLVPFSWPTPRNRQTRRAQQVILSRIQRMIDQRKANPSSAEFNDFLSVLLHARDEEGNHMSEEQVRDEAVTLFRAGHETSATALTWAWYLLAQHPNSYQKMQDEVQSVLQGLPPTYSDLARLPYCLQVFKEALRLYPPVFAFSRVALRDLSIAGYPLHRGETAFIVPYTLHRNERFFPSPDQFDPDRFTPEREKLIPRYAFLPFGAGPRVCIGKYFALMQGPLLLATLAQHVTFEPVPGQTVSPNLRRTTALRPAHGIFLRVRRL